MPLLSPTLSQNDALASALGEAGELEYVQLVSMLQHTQGIFALMLVRSNFTPALRDRLLERLAADLAPVSLSIVCATATKFNVAQMLAESAQFMSGTGVLALVDLEDTPDMVVEGGREMRRPPALASLNHGREALRRACRVPIIVWCSDWVYETIREHAPDFFDHFTGLFQFTDAEAGKPQVLPQSLHCGIGPAPLSFDRRRNHDMVASTVNFYIQELSTHTQQDMERARLLIGLAQALCFSDDGSEAKHLRIAQSMAAEALSILLGNKDEYEWARAQNVMGLIFTSLPDEDRPDNLQRAITFYKEALTVYTEEQFRTEWAEVQANLGDAYLKLRSVLLRSKAFLSQTNSKWWFKQTQSVRLYTQEAIDCFERAARVFTRENLPETWGYLQMSFARAYSLLFTTDEKEKKEAIKRAIACYQAALSVFDRRDYPDEWAMLQRLIGLEYYHLGNYDRRNIRKAIACYHAALQVYTKQAQPYNWAVTHHMMGLALCAKGDDESAMEAWNHAEQVFRSLGKDSEAHEMENLQKMWTETLVSSVT